MRAAETLFQAFGRSRHRVRDPVKRIEALALLMDSAWAIPGTRIRLGADAALGLIPGVGDTITTAIGLYLIWEARNLNLPSSALWRMAGNVALDTVLGAVPGIGDAADIFFRANRRNLAIVREHLAAGRSG